MLNEINSTDLFYDILPTVNNITFFTLKFPKKVDVLLRFLSHRRRWRLDTRTFCEAINLSIALIMLMIS